MAEKENVIQRRVLNGPCAALLISVLVFTVLPFAEGFEAHAAVPKQKQIYKRILSKKKVFREGKSWNDFDNTYSNDFDNGSGCYAFGLKLSDAVFGKKPLYTEHKDLKEMKVGDIVYVNNGTHYVVVLKKRKKYITVVEGNYNRKIHWNRKIKMSSLKKYKYLYILTRYYWQGLDMKEEDDRIELTWPKLTKSQRKKIDGIAVFRNDKLIDTLGKTATSYTDTTLRFGTNYYQLKTYTAAKKKDGTVKYTYSNKTPLKEVFFMGGEE